MKVSNERVLEDEGGSVIMGDVGEGKGNRNMSPHKASDTALPSSALLATTVIKS